MAPTDKQMSYCPLVLNVRSCNCTVNVGVQALGYADPDPAVSIDGVTPGSWLAGRERAVLTSDDPPESGVYYLQYFIATSP